MSVVTTKDIEKAIKKLGIKSGDIVLVHSSLKSFGTVEGGAEAVIEALENVITKDGTLVMPALSQKNFPHALEDWSLDRPSDVGLITETFRKMEGTLRSDQETHSACAKGKYAKDIVGNHKGYGPRYGTYSEWAFSESSPWQKLYDMHAKIVFLGADLSSNTIKHMVEYYLVNDVLDNVDKELYDECKAQIRYSLLPEAHDGIWPYTDMLEMESVFDEYGIIKRTNCGDALLLCVPAYEICNIIEATVRADIDKWMTEQTVAWFKKYGKNFG